jgi:excinuclease ABC subunit C
MPDETLKKKVAKLPRAPGVYLMKDAKGVVLYVGKAKSLRNRVGSYFQERPGDARQRLGDLVGRVADVEVVEADSEVDALLMEARLIKDIQPPFNERLRDSKLYPYLEITLGDDFPGVYVTRRRDRAKSRFYGPFTDARGLRGAVQLMQPVFRFRTCTLAISADDPKRRFQRPCLLHFIGRCTAPCADRVARGDYRKQIGLLQRFLSGKRKGVLQSLRRAMRTAADAYDY